MDKDIQQRADDRFQEALERSGARDPREYYRERLRALRVDDPDAYSQAVEYYTDKLIPSVAAGAEDALDAWREYGRFIAELTSPGRTVEVDPSGRAHPYEPPTASDRMVLHIPEGRTSKALLVGLPTQPTSAQMATYDLLVAGKQRLRESG